MQSYCHIICCILAVIILVFSILTYDKVRKNSEGFSLKSSPPSSAGASKWVNGTTYDCQKQFMNQGCDSSVSCCNCGEEDDGPYYYCDGTMMNAYDINNAAHCNAPFAMNYNQCTSPQKPGPILCGGSLPIDCDYPQKCQAAPNLPYGAAGLCS